MTRTPHHHTRGFTMIEVIVVIGILTTLAGLTIINLPGLQRRSYLDASMSTMLADLRSQQLKAMVGDTEGRSTHDTYGLYLQTTGYTLFHGPAYVAGSSTNVTVAFDNYIVATPSALPQSTVLFASGSGQIVGFSSGSSTITLTNSLNNEQRIATFNRYGVITQRN